MASNKTAAQAFLQALKDRDTTSAMQLLTQAQAAGPAQLSALLMARDNIRRTPLTVAVESGSQEMVSQLLAAGEQVDDAGSARSSNAAHTADTSTLSAMLTARDVSNQPPLLLAALRGNEGLFSQLLAAGAPQIEVHNWWVHRQLHQAAEKGDATVVRLLLRAGEPVDAPSYMAPRRTPLLTAAFHGHVPVVEVLLAAGADVCARDEFGMTALMLAAGMHGWEELVNVLLATAAGRSSVNAVDNRGQTALHCACGFGAAATAQLLLEAGADPLVSRGVLESPLAAAAGYAATAPGHLATSAMQVVDLLLTHPRTADAWTTDTLVAATLRAIDPEDRELSALQRQVISRLLRQALEQDAADAADLFPALIDNISESCPDVLPHIASICMSEWLAVEDSVDMAAEQRTVQQLIMGAAGVFREQQPVEQRRQQQL